MLEERRAFCGWGFSWFTGLGMSEYFPIMKVDPEWAVEREPMGTKDKFWYQEPEKDESLWLFKFPRENTGEHWAEKIAAEAAGLLEIPHARVELAELEPGQTGSAVEPGTVSESFLANDAELIHGNEILASALEEYDPELRFGQGQHTFRNIVEGTDPFFFTESHRRQAAERHCGHVVLDAVIGNTDRHHENWGVISSFRGEGYVFEVAPTFDHASSLGRELTDNRREQILAEQGVGKYSERGHGGIYWSETDRRGPSPLQLARLVCREYPNLFLSALRRVGSIELGTVVEVVRRVPQGWMSEASREFAIALMEYNCRELKKLMVEVSP